MSLLFVPGARGRGGCALTRWIPSTRREALSLIVKTRPVDSTLGSIQAAPILGDVPRVRSLLPSPLFLPTNASTPSQALQQSSLLSTWLAAHLSDLLDRLILLDPTPSSSYPYSLRTYFLLTYADLLQSDPSLWRVVVDYLACCGEEGRARMKGVLMNVRLDGEGEGEVEQKVVREVEMEVKGSEKENAVPVIKTSVVEDVLSVCRNKGWRRR